jgi:hypothetical protein
MNTPWGKQAKHQEIFVLFRRGFSSIGVINNICMASSIIIIGSLRSTTRPAQRRGVNFSSRMSGKKFDYCKKYFTLFQITFKHTATFG